MGRLMGFKSWPPNKMLQIVCIDIIIHNELYIQDSLSQSHSSCLRRIYCLQAHVGTSRMTVSPSRGSTMKYVCDISSRCVCWGTPVNDSEWLCAWQKKGLQDTLPPACLKAQRSLSRSLSVFILSLQNYSYSPGVLFSTYRYKCFRSLLCQWFGRDSI